ncbi:class I SAM-dependent methyltransferase, partial [Ameyamaea chiangmaiensis]|nr:class I SAM-dependent methyltransferase [Ameyamaea chiangmaiensis]
GLSPEDAGRLREGAARLSAPERMGRLFKVVALRAPGLAPLPGFGDEG